jgi:ATP-binding cassette subfamily F protein uup
VILVDLQGVAAARPGRPLYADLSLTVATGDRLGVVGLNGCGKSTLLRVIAGVAEPEAGVVRRGRDVRVASLDQDPDLPPGSVRAAASDDSSAGWEVEAMLDRLGMAALVDADVATLSGARRSGSRWPGPCCRRAAARGTCSSSTSRPTTSTSTPSRGSRSTWPASGAGSSW